MNRLVRLLRLLLIGILIVLGLCVQIGAMQDIRQGFDLDAYAQASEQ